MYQTTPYSKSRRPMFSIDRNAVKRELQALDINIPSSFLWEPSCADAQLVFQSIVESLGGYQINLHRDENEMISHGLEWLVDLGEYHGAVAKLCLLRHAQKIFGEVIGLSENIFIGDLTHPDPMRMAVLCAAFTQCYKYKESKAEMFSSELQQIELLKEEVITASTKLESLTVEGKAVEEEFAAKTETLSEAAALHSEVQTTIKRFHDKFTLSQSKLQAAGAEAQRLDQQERLLISKIEEAKQEKGRLELEVVRSPRRLKRALEDLSNQLSKEQQKLHQTTEHRSLVNKRQELLDRLEDKVTKMKDAVNRLKTRLERTIAQGESLKTTEEELAALEASAAAEDAKLTSAQKLLNQQICHNKQLQASHAKELEELANELQYCSNCLSERKTSLESQTQLAETLEATCKSNEAAVDMLNRTRQHSVEICQNLEQRLLTMLRTNIKENIAHKLHELGSVYSNSNGSPRNLSTMYLTANFLDEQRDELESSDSVDSPLMLDGHTDTAGKTLDLIHTEAKDINSTTNSIDVEHQKVVQVKKLQKDRLWSKRPSNSILTRPNECVDPITKTSTNADISAAAQWSSGPNHVAKSMAVETQLPDRIDSHRVSKMAPFSSTQRSTYAEEKENQSTTASNSRHVRRGTLARETLVTGSLPESANAETNYICLRQSYR